MEQILSSLNAPDLVAIGLGLVLLVVGRKLYWMALGGLGFLLGLWLAVQLFDLRSGWIELGLGLLAGLLCGYLAVFAQRVAVGIGGFVLGGAGAFWIAPWLEAAAGLELGPWIWALVLLGALLGAALAPGLFELSLVVFTSLAGALLVTSRSHLGPAHETWLFLILLLVGVFVQSRGRRPRRPGR